MRWTLKSPSSCSLKYSVFLLLGLLSLASCQVRFGGSQSSGSSSSASSASAPSTSASDSSSGSQVDTRFFTGNSNTNNLITGGLLGAGLGVGISALLNSNNNNNPCGRKKRQSDDGSEVDTRFFLGGGNSNTNCNNNFNNNNNGCNCRCTQQTFRSGGQIHGNCQAPDHTGRHWCYTTGFGNCGDFQKSQRYPNNPWSYNACAPQRHCSNIRSDCKGRHAGNEFFGCGCRTKRQDTRIIDLRCAKASLLGRSALPNQK